MDGKALAIARNIRNCATTNLVGDWKRATLPTSSPGGCRPATDLIWDAAAACVVHQYLLAKLSLYFPKNKSYFCSRMGVGSMHCICFLPTPASLHTRLHIFVLSHYHLFQHHLHCHHHQPQIACSLNFAVKQYLR